jgi:hypothetical protein
MFLPKSNPSICALKANPLTYSRSLLQVSNDFSLLEFPNCYSYFSHLCLLGSKTPFKRYLYWVSPDLSSPLCSGFPPITQEHCFNDLHEVKSST